jgi:hypothetical protein
LRQTWRYLDHVLRPCYLEIEKEAVTAWRGCKKVR